MEKAVVDWEQNTLLIELITQGKELAEQLRNHQLDPSLSPEYCHFLIDKILFSYEKALSMLKWDPSMAQIRPISQASESSPIPLSPKSNQFRRDVHKKRMTQPRWTERVKVCLGTGMEDGPLYDGYSWRKYGQKDILGANFPRAYYRCTHRHSQGCLAIKQVQRSDEDPTIFEVTYRGRHTCIQSKAFHLPNTCPKQIMGNFQIDPLVEEPFTNIGEVIKTEALNCGDKIFPSSSFPYSSVGNESEENNFFMDSIPSENNLLYSMSPCHMDGNGLVSVHTSVKNSPFGDLEITIEDWDFNCGLPFDNSQFFDLHKLQ